MKRMPQILSQTGISADYYNEVMGVAMSIETCDRSWFTEELRKKPLKRYEERYSTQEFTEVVTDKNRGSVKRLDEIVDALNKSLAAADRFTDQQMLDYVNELQMLIIGHSNYPQSIDALRRK